MTEVLASRRRAIMREAFAQAYEAQRAYTPPAGKWNSALFTFTRALRSYEGLWDCPANEMASDALFVMMERCSQDKHQHVAAEAWRCHFPGCDDPMMEFVTTWSRITTPANGDALSRAAEMAEHEPLPVSTGTAAFGRFISIAYHLQRERPTQPIMLPCKKLAQILHCEPRTVSRYRQFASDSGLLTRTKQGRFTSKEADEFTFHLERFSADRQELPNIEEERKPAERSSPVHSNNRFSDSKNESSREVMDSIAARANPF